MRLLMSILVFSLFCSCSSNELTRYSVTGRAQKGPFLIGSNVIIAELDEQLNQTGNVFLSTILDNQGSFDIPDVEFASNLALIQIEGNYFDETRLRGEASVDEITLFAIADLRNSANINVNLLTHFEKDRVEILVAEGQTFSEAKNNAFNELLAVFGLSSTTLNSTSLDITNDGLLLAISTLFGFSVEAENFIPFITRFRADFREDGQIDEQLEQQLAISAAAIVEEQLLFDPTESIVRDETKSLAAEVALTQIYEDNGLEISVPDIDPILQEFVDNTGFTNLFQNVTPEPSDGSINLLRLSPNEQLDLDRSYSLSIDTPENIDYEISISLTSQTTEFPDFSADFDQWEFSSSNSYFLTVTNNFQESSIVIPVTFQNTGNAVLSAFIELNGYTVTRLLTISW